jgi:hypothetical protein
MTTPPKKRRSRSRRGSGTGKPTPSQHTSLPTSRAAYQETRRWLLDEHGAVCAYCAGRFRPADMTLDHVAPRRGQSAYDRRDNLVLACKACNAAKADMPLLAFLLRKRERAVSLAQYGVHLSDGLRNMILEIADGVIAGEPASVPADDASPYADVAYREPLRPYRMVSHDVPPPAALPAPADGVAEDAPAAPKKRRRGGRKRR